MNLEVNGIFSRGTDEERVSMTVIKDTNLKNFMLVDMSFNKKSQLSEKGKHVFCFPELEVKKGDYLILYTRPLSEGQMYNFARKDDLNYHFFSFGFDSRYSIWKNIESSVSMFEIADYYTGEFSKGQIYISGDAVSLNREVSKYVFTAKVVGLMDLGDNNGDNSYGWSGLKAVVIEEENLFLVDVPEDSLLIDPDGNEVRTDQPWTPNTSDYERYNLVVFQKDSL